MDIESLKLEGTPTEVAEQLFKQMIGPMFEHLKRSDPQMATEFGYCIAGYAIACYMNSLDNINQAEQLIINSTQSMAVDIKRTRKKAC